MPHPAARPAQRRLLYLGPALPAVDLHPAGRDVPGRGGARLQPAHPGAPAAGLRRGGRPRLRLRLLPGARGLPEKYSPAYLTFQTYVRPDRQAYASIAALGYPAPQLQPGLAAFLTDYGRYFYVPGPVFAAGLVLAVAGLVTGWRRLAARPHPAERAPVHH